MSTQKFLDFISFSKDFARIKRQVWRKYDGSQESDAEHSFQLALVSWMIIEKEKLDLDISLVIKYALVHDLVEVYAGDVSAFASTEVREEKEKKEEEGRLEFRKKFPEQEEIHYLMEKYEKRKDEEAKFVYALDKMIPLANIYLDGGYSWEKNDLSLSEILENKKDKVSLHPTVEKYFKEIMKEVTEREEEFFAFRFKDKKDDQNNLKD